MFFNGNHGKVVITTPTEENRTLLVIKDSYANSLIPFLAPYYRKIVMVDPRYFYDDLEELMQVEEIQEVLYLYNANTFYADTSLELAIRYNYFIKQLFSAKCFLERSSQKSQ